MDNPVRKAVLEYETSLIEQARSAYKNHEILAEGDGFWICGQRGSSAYKFEARSLLFGVLYVGGDIDHICFSCYSDDKDPERKLRWMGEHDDVSYYVAQKATIGMGADSVVWSFDSKVAIAELKETLAEAGRAGRAAKAEEVAAAIEDLKEGSDVGEIVRRLYESDAFDFEDLPGNLGRVVSPRLVYAWQAAKKVVQLLDARKQPPLQIVRES